MCIVFALLLGADHAVVLVGHGLFYDRLLKSLLSIPTTPDNEITLMTANCAYWLVHMKTQPKKDGSRKRSAMFLTSNETSHLPEDRQTGHTKHKGLDIRFVHPRSVIL